MWLANSYATCACVRSTYGFAVRVYECERIFGSDIRLERAHAHTGAQTHLHAHTHAHMHGFAERFVWYIASQLPSHERSLYLELACCAFEASVPIFQTSSTFHPFRLFEISFGLPTTTTTTIAVLLLRLRFRLQPVVSILFLLFFHIFIRTRP